jgi:hypothetical protein
MDGGSGAGAIHFTKEELKDLFSLDVSTQSITHDQLNCQCLHRQKSNSLEELLVCVKLKPFINRGQS